MVEAALPLVSRSIELGIRADNVGSRGGVGNNPYVPVAGLSQSRPPDAGLVALSRLSVVALGCEFPCLLAVVRERHRYGFICFERVSPRHVQFERMLAETLPVRVYYRANSFPSYQPPVVGSYGQTHPCLLYTSPSPRDRQKSRMPSSA